MKKRPKDKICYQMGASVEEVAEGFGKLMNDHKTNAIKIEPEKYLFVGNILAEKVTQNYLIELIDQNYQAVRDRGLINDETDWYDFMEKLDEETHELAVEYYKMDGFPDKSKTEFASELIDCLSVLLNMAKHYNIDVIEGLKENIIKNQERAKSNK